MRGWANRELGDSVILYVAAADASGFEFLIGPDKDWIVLEDRNGIPQQSCLLDRGDNLFTRFNITVPDL